MINILIVILLVLGCVALGIISWALLVTTLYTIKQEQNKEVEPYDRYE